MENCIFCKIAKGDIPCAKVYEDSEFLAFLDINPNTKGMTLVIPKKHSDSYIFNNENNLIHKLMDISKIVSKKIEKALGVKKVAIVFEGQGVNHLHAKIYPMHGLKKEWKVLETKDKVFFDKYPNYITTKVGPLANYEELNKLAEKISEN